MYTGHGTTALVGATETWCVYGTGFVLNSRTRSALYPRPEPESAIELSENHTNKKYYGA